MLGKTELSTYDSNLSDWLEEFIALLDIELDEHSVFPIELKLLCAFRKLHLK